MKKCPNCGNVTGSAFCGECGTDLREVPEADIVRDQTNVDASAEPIDPVVVDAKVEDINNESTVQHEVGATSEKSGTQDINKKTGKTKLGIIGLMAVAAIAIFLVLVFVVGGNASKKEDYKVTLHTMWFQMSADAAATEEACNLITSVWHDAIFENTNEADTKKYVAGASDFDEALGNLFADEEFQKKIENIESGQDAVDKMMDELKDPPEDYKDLYKEAVDLYTDYSEFNELATNPSGSYNSYSEKFEQLDTSLAKSLKRFETLLPE